MRTLVLLCVVLLLAGSAASQQVADASFVPVVGRPAFAVNQGPHVCVDAAHHNFHTIDGRYSTFAELLRRDGYVVTSFDAEFTNEDLAPCSALVIANPIGVANAQDWAYPHTSAFSRDEIDALLTWIGNGGALLLIVDHEPHAGAARDLALMLGVNMLDGVVGPNPESLSGAAVFGTPSAEALDKRARALGQQPEQVLRTLGPPGTLGSHPILEGRAANERIESVVTFTGHAFFPSREVEPLLTLGPLATAHTVVGENFAGVPASDGPQFAVGGWLQGGAIRVQQGRVVVLGEAAMCSAQLVGAQKRPLGMNQVLASQNAQFCLNVVHWLTHVLEP